MAATARRVVGDLPLPQTMSLDSLYAYTTHRDPALLVGGEFGVPNASVDMADEHTHVHGWATIDPRTGENLPDD